MSDDKAKRSRFSRLGPNGEHIFATPEEEAQQKEAMRKAVKGEDGMSIEFAPGMAAQLAAMGLTAADIMKWLTEVVEEDEQKP